MRMSLNSPLIPGLWLGHLFIISNLKFLHGSSLKFHLGHSVWDPGEWSFGEFRSIRDVISLFMGLKRILRILFARWFLIKPVPCRHIVQLRAMRLERVQREPKLESISWIYKITLFRPEPLGVPKTIIPSNRTLYSPWIQFVKISDLHF